MPNISTNKIYRIMILTHDTRIYPYNEHNNKEQTNQNKKNNETKKGLCYAFSIQVQKARLKIKEQKAEKSFV